MDKNTELLEYLVTEYVMETAWRLCKHESDNRGMTGDDFLPIDPFIPEAVKLIKARRLEVMALMTSP